MATNRFIGAAPAIAQVDTFTPASLANTNTITLTSGNGTTVTYTCVGATVSVATAGIVALLNSLSSPPPPEFADVSWTDIGTAVVGTAKVPGKPFTITSGASGGTATFTRAATKANSGPNSVALAGNWSLGIPVNGQDLDISGHAVSMLYDLTYLRDNSIVPATVSFKSDWFGQPGLPIQNLGGYPEYRPCYLQLDVATCTFASRSTRGRLDFGSTAVALTINDTGISVDPGLETLLIIGSTITPTINKGSVGFAVQTGETATVTSPVLGFISNIQNDANVRFGSGCAAITALKQNGGNAITNQAVTTWTGNDGTLTHKTGAITTANAKRATLNYNSSSSLAAYVGSGQDILVLNQTAVAKTVTAYTGNKGSKIQAAGVTVTWTGQIIHNNCALGDIDIDLGINLKIAPTLL